VEVEGGEGGEVVVALARVLLETPQLSVGQQICFQPVAFSDYCL
jgi:hypothetical protein